MERSDYFDRDVLRSYLRFSLSRSPLHIDLLYTIMTWAGIAVFLMATGLRRPHVATIVVCECIGISLFCARRCLYMLFKPQTIFSLILILLAALVIGLSIGYLIAGFFLWYTFSYILRPNLFQLFVFFVIYTAIVTSVFYSRHRLELSREQAQQERVKRLSVEKEAVEGNLRLLQAQIEPHFLFNTLSNTISLIDTDPAKGKSILEDLVCYLRTSLSRTLPAVTTLGQEIDSIKAYLNIQKIRMSERLSFVIDIPEALIDHPFPPMLIQPLVENAVKHGLEPNIDGGAITIKVLAANGTLRIEVADTGNGLPSTHEAGIGISNVKERIKLLYGEKGHFILEENTPRGAKAVIVVSNSGR